MIPKFNLPLFIVPMRRKITKTNRIEQKTIFYQNLTRVAGIVILWSGGFSNKSKRPNKSFEQK
jgi:hypothetical protein